MKGGNNIEIKIIGANCSNGMKLSKMVSRAIEEVDIDNIKVEEVDFAKNKYGVSNVPGLVINGKKISEGKVLTVREIKKLLLA